MIIVGSGAGGGILAEQLAEKGKKVLVVEAGPYVRPEEFRRDMSHTFSHYFWEGGMRALRGNAMLPTMQGRCLGGTTVFNSAICMRPSEHAMELWAREEGVEGLSLAELDPHLDAVERIMHIRPTQPDVQGRRNELFREGLAVLGWEGEAIRRNENGCQGSAGCMYGCQKGAKVSTEQCVERAVQNGAVVYTSVTVDKLIMDGDRVRGVEGSVLEPMTNKKCFGARFTAKDCVVLAAGVLATPQIMQRTGLKHKGIGANLRVHPSLYAMGTFNETVMPWTGATQGWHCTEFIKSGIKLESMWADAGVLSEKFPSNPEQFQRHIKDYSQAAAWAGWVSGDDSVGSVRAMPGGRADFVFHLGDGDIRRLQEANAKLAELFLAAGAKEVFTGINGAPEAIRSARDIKRIRTGTFSATDLPSGSNHVFGTSAMGGDRDKHVTDSLGAVYAAQDLFVCDTGLFPRTPGVNPQQTIMALAHRMGETLAARY